MADSFDVRDASGQPAFQLRGAHMSMREVPCPHSSLFCVFWISTVRSHDSTRRLVAEEGTMPQEWADSGHTDQ